ncbi:hypothetical protein BDV06DRAFT_200707 [Aspergillus oleicola]
MPSDQEVRAKQELLESLLKEYKIQFVRSSNDNALASLYSEFEFIKRIEQVEFESYIESNNETDPAILKNNLHRARNLLRDVDRCAQFEANEEQWRREVENGLFGILRRPMICSMCDKRLWRAGIEFPIDVNLENDAFIKNLQKRRGKRAICCCHVPRFQSEPPAPAHIFDFKVSKMVQYEPNLRKRVVKGKHPDLILGLTNNIKFEKILDAPLDIQGKIDDNETVGSVLKTDLFASTSGMIFPFLVLEAKQGRTPESQRDIERQMALPAYEMLRMQTCLLERSTLVDPSNRLPRVWLISSKAEIWKVYIGTAVLGEGQGYVYKIHHMWTGDISTATGALRLILLLDGILDWARDIYRMSVFDHLSSMASRHDSDNPLNRLTMTPVSEVFGRLSRGAPIAPSLPATTPFSETREYVLECLKKALEGTEGRITYQ